MVASLLKHSQILRVALTNILIRATVALTGSSPAKNAVSGPYLSVRGGKLTLRSSA